MKILGIDPGTSLIGYGIIESAGSKLKVIKQGVFRTEKNLTTQERVVDVYSFFIDLIKTEKPDIASIEKLFFQNNAKTAMQVGEIRGVILLALKISGLEVREFTPLQVKQAVSNYGRASKEQVQNMVKLILSLEKIPKPDDIADALAIAICCANTNMDLI